jgi:hypothetical protein
MRTTIITMLLLCMFRASAQENQTPVWQLSPTLSLTKYFPGENIAGAPGWNYGGPILAVYGYPVPGRVFRYAGTGVNFAVRAFNDQAPNMALTFGAGVTWYYDAEQTGSSVVAMAVSGVGDQIGRGGFTAFPISLGLQFVYPYAGRENFMVFGGLEGNLHLISGNVPMGDQAKLGFGLNGGFAVKIFEFGVRYTQFSDMKNLGASLGFRLNSFSL